jgi:hypothetical protein
LTVASRPKLSFGPDGSTNLWMAFPHD